MASRSEIITSNLEITALDYKDILAINSIDSLVLVLLCTVT
jgi:hypothetical protein